MQRKLTTIIIADVAGYSRLMSRDEEGTHARLHALLRQLVEPAVASRAGRVIKTTGDGFLAEFASVVEAVRCAIEIQEGAARRNVGLSSEEGIAFRIGVNLGDVIIEGDDIYGDGVNIAARLEGLAEPGGIVVSRAVRDHVRDKLGIGFDDLGEQTVKNIPRPVRAFRVREPGAADAAPLAAARPRNLRRGVLAGAAALAVAIAIGGGMVWLGPADPPPAATAPPTPSSVADTLPATPAPRLSIVVLPFANLGSNAQQDYVADGITQSLTTDLSRALPGSFVVARGTAYSYKGKQVDPRQVGRDLNVRYLLEGSVLADGDRLRVGAELIDTETGTQLWAERFDSKWNDLLEIEDRIVGRLSRSVGLELVAIEAKRSERARAGDLTAVDFVMRGQAIANRPSSPANMTAARALFQRALEHDPDDVDALAGVANTYVFEVLNSYYDTGREQRLRDAKALVRRALEIEPRHIVALKAQSALLRAEGNLEEAIAASRVVIAQNPGEPWSYKEVGLSELYLGRFHEALQWFEKARQIGPRDPSRWIWLGAMGRTEFFLGHNDEAIRLLRMAGEANSNDAQAFALLAAIYALSGRKGEASQALADCLRLRPELTIGRLFADWPVPLQATSPAYRQQHERFREGLRLAGMPEG